jgi:N-acetylglutamate synthase-like GNAT family acetyltransferase
MILLIHIVTEGNPAYQGNRIGTQLLLHCITEARTLNAHQVFISSVYQR